MESCWDFRDEVSAINKSWICLPRFTVDRSYSATSNETFCLFLYEQQYNRSNWYCGPLEAALIIVLSIAVFPANFFAVRNFWKRGVTREFLLLISAIPFYNVVIGLLGLMKGFARLYPDWPLGQIGCSLTIPLGSYALTASMLTMTLISFERRFCVSRCTNVVPPSRYFYTLAALVLVNIFSALFWAYPFIYLEVLRVLPTYIDGVKNGTEPADLCLFMPFKVSGSSSTMLTMFTTVTFILPLVLTTANYWSILSFVRTAHYAPSQCGNKKDGFKSSPVPERATQDRLSLMRRRREAFLSALMAASILEFVVCILPMSVAGAYVVFDIMATSYRLQSTTIYISNLLIILDSVLNPFWSSIVRYKADHGTGTPAIGIVNDDSDLSSSRVQQRLGKNPRAAFSNMSTIQSFELSKTAPTSERQVPFETSATALLPMSNL